MLVAFLALVVAGFWLAVFFGFHAARGESFRDSFRGPLVPLPPDLGLWRPIVETPSELIEERLLFDEDRPTILTRQRRTRDRATGAITSVEPEERLRRPRRRD